MCIRDRLEMCVKRLGYNNENIEEKVVFLASDQNYMHNRLEVIENDNLQRVTYKRQEGTDQEILSVIKSLKEDLSGHFGKVNNGQLMVGSMENGMEGLSTSSGSGRQGSGSQNSMGGKTVTSVQTKEEMKSINKKQSQSLGCFGEDKIRSKSSSNPCLSNFMRGKFGSCIRIDTNG